MMIAPIFAMLLTPAHATDVQVGAALSLDGSMGLNTGIPRLGVHPGLSALVGGEHHGLQVDARYQMFHAYGLWERFPTVGLSWSMGWGDGPVRPYHTLGAGLAITGVMDTALAPALPLGLVGGGVEIRRDQLWMRAGLQGFFAPAPALGLGPELIAGWNF